MAIFIQLDKIIPAWDSASNSQIINGKIFKKVGDMLVYSTIAQFYKRGLITIDDMKNKPANIKSITYAWYIINQRRYKNNEKENNI